MTEAHDPEDTGKVKLVTEIPEEPEDTGSSGTQEAADPKATETEKEISLQILPPMVRAVEGLAANKSRGIGGETTSKLIAGAFSQLSHDQHQTKHELSATQKKLDETKEDLSNVKVKAAVLRERVKSLTSGRHLKNLSITAGTALVGISIEFYRNTFEKIAFIVGGLGILLILLGWLSHKEGAEE